MHRLVPFILLFCGFLSTHPKATGEEPVKITGDVVYGHKDGLALTMDVLQPQTTNRAGVLYLVSGGWSSRYVEPTRLQKRFIPLFRAGFTVFVVRHGSSPRYVIPEIVVDVRRAVRFVRHNAQKFGVDSQRLGVFGGSAGGHLSLMLGTTADGGNVASLDPILRNSDHVAAVVAYYPPTDLQPWVTDKTSRYYENFPALRFDPKKAATYSPLLQVTGDDAPTLLIHGDQDKLVPIEHSQNIMEEFRSPKVPAELITIKDAAHGFREKDATTADLATVKWFRVHLLEKQPTP